MNVIPIYDDTAPIACTAGGVELSERAGQLERLRSAMTGIERSADGLRLRFAPSAGTEADLRQFAKDEKGCCQFWGFEVDAEVDALTLRWDGPPSVATLMDRLHAWFLSDGPMTELSGLL